MCLDMMYILHMIRWWFSQGPEKGKKVASNWPAILKMDLVVVFKPAFARYCFNFVMFMGGFEETINILCWM